MNLGDNLPPTDQIAFLKAALAKKGTKASLAATLAYTEEQLAKATNERDALVTQLKRLGIDEKPSERDLANESYEEQQAIWQQVKELSAENRVLRDERVRMQVEIDGLREGLERANEWNQSLRERLK